jgi:hypothetical protein
MFLLKLLLLSVFILYFSAPVSARGMWGARRKKSDDEAQADLGEFEARQREAVSRRSIGLEGAALGGENNVGIAIKSLIDMYLNMMQEVVNSPDFETSVTPETIRSMLDKIPGLSSNTEIATMLDSPQFNDPSLLKQTIIDGMKTIEAYAGQIVEMFNDPEKLASLLSQLPLEYQGAFQGLLNGDMSSLKDLVLNVPGVDLAQKKMILDLLDGKTDAVTDSVQKVLSDPNQIEAARQQFLENPAMAEMLGLPLDVLQDKKKFASLMSEGMEQLMSAGAAESDDSDISSNRLFKGSAMSG